MRRIVPAGVIALALALSVPLASAQVLRVGTYKGIPGQFASIQSAVNAAEAGDWVLVAPGDYKTAASSAPQGHPEFPAGVLITTPNLYLRGMNRNSVVVDGTKPGSARCSANAADQNFGPALDGKPAGLNGVEVWEASNVWVQNMTVCNFLGGSGDAGNGIWWNGGANSGRVGGHGFLGSYLNATSTFFKDETSAATYGIFSSNWSGGTWDQTYASNFNDSGYYIGACQQICDQTVNHAWAEYNALGYSGSNSGGALVIKNSEFDNNEDGFDTNSQNGDNPPPQDGACPNKGISPITHTHSCWVFMDNFVHDNNNPNVPSAGAAAAGPVGTGMSVSGGRNDTIMNNRFEHNNAWAVILVPYPDSGPPCTGGITSFPGVGCLYDQWGDALVGNQFAHNGSYGHPSNGDFAEINLTSGHPTDCYKGNTEEGGGALTADSASLQTSHPDCTSAPAGVGTSNPMFLTEALCDTQVELVSGVPAVCPTGPYPRRTAVVMHPLPRSLPTMPKPCSGVPADPWCAGAATRVKRCAAATVSVQLSVAAGETLTSVSVKVGRGKAESSAAHGRRTTVSVTLAGQPHSTVRVRFVEHIKVSGHRESTRFTNVYKRC